MWSETTVPADTDLREKYIMYKRLVLLSHSLCFLFLHSLSRFLLPFSSVLQRGHNTVLLSTSTAPMPDPSQTIRKQPQSWATDVV